MSTVSDVYEELFEEHPELRDFADVICVPPTIEEVSDNYPEVMADTELRDEGAAPTKVRCITRLALYVISRRRGNSHAFAALAACQKFPMGMTDDVFWGGRPHFAEVYGEEYFHDVKRLLAQRGTHLGANDEYLPELAQFKGDPQAVVTRSQGTGYIKRRCEALGLECHGAVEVKGREPESDPWQQAAPLAEDLVQANIKRATTRNPALRDLSRDELRRHVIQKYGRQN
jgi:hypothetical protein